MHTYLTPDCGSADTYDAMQCKWKSPETVKAHKPSVVDSSIVVRGGGLRVAALALPLKF